MNHQQALYPIREVSNLTGINPITLRAWERRYSLIEPVRTDGGHRLYTAQHIETIKQAIKLTEQGVPISHVKGLIKQTIQPKTEFNPATDQALNALQIETWLTQDDFNALNLALDTLFIDLDDTTLYDLLSQLSLQVADLQHPAHALWINAVLPKLYTRLQHRSKVLLTQPRLSRQLVVALEGQENPLLTLLTALWLTNQGVYPILDTAIKFEFKHLLEHAKRLHCTGLVLVSLDPNNPNLLALWLENQHSKSSLELTVCSRHNSLQMPNTALNSHLIIFTELFLPKSLN